MKIEVRYFASIREVLGAGEAVDAGDAATVGALRDLLIGRGGVHAARWIGRCARNRPC